MSVESHIQLPKSIIKSFSHKELVTGDNGFKNKTDFVYTLSFGCFDVESIKTREYGSQFGYFTEDVEELLSNKYESPLGNTRKKIVDFSMKKTKEITITPDDYIVLKNYLKMLFYRSKYFYNLYLRESKLAPFLDNSPSEYVEICDITNVNPISYFDKYSVAVVLATGDREFVNSFTGFTFVKDEELSFTHMFFTPLSPRSGILFFIPKSDKREDIYLETQLANSETTLRINHFIAITEKIYSRHSLIAKQQSELNEIKDIFNKK